MTKIHRTLAAAAAAGALTLTAAPAVSAAEAAPTAAPQQTVTQAADCPAAEKFQLTAPSHTEVAGNLLDKQITFGSYWTGGFDEAGTQATLTASGPAEVTLFNGQTYTADVVAGGSNSGIFPGGGAAFAPSLRLQDSDRGLLREGTQKYHVTDITYPVTVSGNFGSCEHEVVGTATSKFNVTSIELRDA